MLLNLYRTNSEVVNLSSGGAELSLERAIRENDVSMLSAVFKAGIFADELIQLDAYHIHESRSITEEGWGEGL